jgi:hypothetical protein
MAATRLGQIAPRTSLSYSDNVDGGKSGSFAEIWNSTLTDPDDALQEILTASETVYGFTLGSSFAEPPFSSTIIIGREIRPIHDDETSHYVLTFSLGPVSQKLLDVPVAADWVYSFSSQLSQSETNVDADGAFITVGTITNGADPLPSSGPPYTTVPKSGAQVQKMFPSLAISARAQVLVNPLAASRDIIGKTNLDSVTMDGQVFAIGTLMLTGASISTPNEGEYYTVEYSFEYRSDPLDWFAVVVAIDPKTGKPYQGISGTHYNATPPVDKGTISVADGSIGYKIYGASVFAGLFTLA